MEIEHESNKDKNILSRKNKKMMSNHRFRFFHIKTSEFLFLQDLNSKI